MQRWLFSLVDVWIPMVTECPTYMLAIPIHGSFVLCVVRALAVEAWSSASPFTGLWIESSHRQVTPEHARGSFVRINARYGQSFCNHIPSLRMKLPTV